KLRFRCFSIIEECFRDNFVSYFSSVVEVKVVHREPGLGIKRLLERTFGVVPGMAGRAQQLGERNPRTASQQTDVGGDCAFESAAECAEVIREPFIRTGRQWRFIAPVERVKQLVIDDPLSLVGGNPGDDEVEIPPGDEVTRFVCCSTVPSAEWFI